MQTRCKNCWQLQPCPRPHGGDHTDRSPRWSERRCRPGKMVYQNTKQKCSRMGCQFTEQERRWLVVVWRRRGWMDWKGWRILLPLQSSSSSSSAGASLAGHSRLHEFSPLGTVLRTLPRLFNPTWLMCNTNSTAQHYRRKERKQTLRKRTGTHVESFQTKHLHNLNKNTHKITQCWSK